MLCLLSLTETLQPFVFHRTKMSFQNKLCVIRCQSHGRGDQSRSSRSVSACVHVGVGRYVVTSRAATNGAGSSHINRCYDFPKYIRCFLDSFSIVLIQVTHNTCIMWIFSIVNSRRFDCSSSSSLLSRLKLRACLECVVLNASWTLRFIHITVAR